MRNEPESIFLNFTKFILDLAQSSLSAHQFEAFRKLVWDAYAKAKRQGQWEKTHYDAEDFNTPK